MDEKQMSSGSLYVREDKRYASYVGGALPLLEADIVRPEWIANMEPDQRRAVVGLNEAATEILSRQGKGNWITRSLRQRGLVTIHRRCGGEYEVIRYRTSAEELAFDRAQQVALEQDTWRRAKDARIVSHGVV